MIIATVIVLGLILLLVYLWYCGILQVVAEALVAALDAVADALVAILGGSNGD